LYFVFAHERRTIASSLWAFGYDVIDSCREKSQEFFTSGDDMIVCLSKAEEPRHKILEIKAQ